MPGGPTRCAAYDGYFSYTVILHKDVQFRKTELFFISPQATRPGKTASGRRCDDVSDTLLFTGGDDRDSQSGTKPDQVVRKIGVL